MRTCGLVPSTSTGIRTLPRDSVPAITSRRPGGQGRQKRPFGSVCSTRSTPSIWTVASGTGSPETSTTTPQRIGQCVTDALSFAVIAGASVAPESSSEGEDSRTSVVMRDVTTLFDGCCSNHVTSGSGSTTGLAGARRTSFFFGLAGGGAAWRATTAVVSGSGGGGTGCSTGAGGTDAACIAALSADAAIAAYDRLGACASSCTTSTRGTCGGQRPGMRISSGRNCATTTAATSAIADHLMKRRMDGLRTSAMLRRHE